MKYKMVVKIAPRAYIIEPDIEITVDRDSLSGDLDDMGRIAKKIGTNGIGKEVDGELIYYPPHRITSIEVSKYGKVDPSEETKKVNE